MLEDPRHAVKRESEVKAFLKQIHLFKDLSDEDIDRVYSRLTFDTARKDKQLFAQGDAPTHFYIIFQGGVRITQEENGESHFVAQLERGDFFGEIALLTGRYHSGTAILTTRTTLLAMTSENFTWLIREFPTIAEELEIIVKGILRFRQQRGMFGWLSEDESIYLLEGKHPMVLWLSLIVPAIFTAAAVAGIYFLRVTTIPWLIYFCWIGFGLGILWGFLRYIDWRNDFYVITDRRVLWQEKIILVYESRQEAPLETLLSVNLDTTLIQRLVGYGDLVVRTYTGSIRMRDMERPHHFKAALEEYWFRARKVSEGSKAEEVEKTIRTRLDLIPEPPPKKKKKAEDEDAEEAEEAEKKPAEAKSSAAANIFKVRYEEKGVVTYRKHWFLLIRRVSILAIILALLLVVFGARLTGLIELFSTRSYVGVILGLILITSPFWIYQYLDWSNDKYQVSEREIVDLEKRPLGREVRKSAPLENILSMEHRRIGIFGLLLNFGTVILNVGDAEFEFIGVHNPADVQREVFDKFTARRRQMDLEEDARKREIVLESLEVYDRIVNEYLKEAKNVEEEEKKS